jgi:hypothetical protein
MLMIVLRAGQFRRRYDSAKRDANELRVEASW